MHECVLVTTADVPAGQLWAAAANVRDWPVWQPGAGPGVWARLVVEEAVPPVRLVAAAERFLARVRFVCEFGTSGRGTRVRVAVSLHGPLGFAYRRALDRHLQRTLSTLVARLVERARGLDAPGDPDRPAGVSVEPAVENVSRPASGAAGPVWGPLGRIGVPAGATSRVDSSGAADRSAKGIHTMRAIIGRTFRAFRQLALTALVVGAGCAAAYLAHQTSSKAGPASDAAPKPAEPEKVEKVKRIGRDGVSVSSEVVRNMGLRTAVVSDAVRPIQLPPLQGTLALDSNALSRVHSRFAGEVISVGQGGDEALAAGSPGLASLATPLRVGDRVRKGDLLAVVWSKDLGEKKSELVDAVSKLRSDEVTLRRLQDGFASASVSERSVRDAERAVESDRIAVDRIERTLRSWRLTDAEVADVRAEADRSSAPGSRRPDPAGWARVEIRSPQDGVLLEKNLTGAGQWVGTDLPMFQVGDLAHLAVWAHVYEEDLPLVQSLPRPVRWTVSVPSRPGATFPGALEQIGAVIDPNQHTALVTGRVENPNGDLKAGQFVTVSIALPPPQGQLELPADAVVEDGRESVVFVQPAEGEQRFVRVPVQVARRFRDGVCVRSGQGLRPGDRVVTGGALLLRDAMDELPVPQ